MIGTIFRQSISDKLNLYDFLKKGNWQYAALTKMRLFEKYGLSGKFEDLVFEKLGKPDNAQDEREYILASTDEAAKDSLLIFNEALMGKRWTVFKKGEPVKLLSFVNDVVDEIVNEALKKEAAYFERRQKSRQHLRASKGYCNGEICNCILGASI